MLDDLKLIHERDAQDCLGIVARQWKQLAETFEAAQSIEAVDNIVYAGMGSSALAAMLYEAWRGSSVPFTIVREYDIPEYVNERTLVIAASSSGNTEETVSAVTQAAGRGAQIAVIAGGGALAELAKERGYPLFVLPKLEQARFGMLYNLKALTVLLSAAGLADASAVHELEASVEVLRECALEWEATVPTSKNLAKQIALECIGKSVVVYSGPKLWPIAYKWKISFNENAKQVSWASQLPEFSHNEFMGWTQQPQQKPYTVIELRSDLEHPRVAKRFTLTERLLSGRRPAPLVVETKGEGTLQQLLWSLLLGDYVTIYTALLSGLNPGPVELVEKFKKEMG